MTPLQTAADALTSLLRASPAAEIDPSFTVLADEAAGTLVVTTSMPKDLVKVVPFRYSGFPVKLVAAQTAGLTVGARVRNRRSGALGSVTGEVAPSGQVNVLWDDPEAASWTNNMERTRHTSNMSPADLDRVDGTPTGLARRPSTDLVEVVEVLPVRRAAPAETGLVAVDEDRRLWEAIAGRGDALAGMDFATAARQAPLRVEALIHAHIFTAFSPVQGPGAEGPQRGTYLLRNQTLRQVHGEITPLMLADQLRRSGEDHAMLFAAQRQQAADAGMERQMLQSAAAILPAVRRAFAEGRSVAMRAAEVTYGDTRDGWAQVALVVRAMGEAMVTILSPGPLPPGLAGTRAIEAAPRRIGVQD